MKNRGAEGGGWRETESHEEAGMELDKGGWTRGTNGNDG